MSQRCNVVNLRMLANCCVWKYTQVDLHGLQISFGLECSDFRILTTHILFTLSIFPTWRRSFVLSSMASLHLMYSVLRAVSALAVGFCVDFGRIV